MSPASRPVRRVDALDVAASAVVRLAPRALATAVDRVRLDAHAVLDGLRGVRTPSFSTRSRPPVAPPRLRDIDPLLHLLPRPMRRPYQALARDVGTVLRELRGERSSPTVPRRPHATTAAAPNATDVGGHGASLPHRPQARAAAAPRGGPRRVRIAAVQRETADALSLVLEPLDGVPIPFEPGQFLTLLVPIDGVVHKRAYSLSSTPSDGFARITCKRIAGGLVSSHLHERARAGDVLEVLGPSGAFVPPPDTRHAVLVAGGSGITPCWSIARALVERGARVTLIYGNRSEGDIVFAAAIDALARARADVFRVVHVLSEPRGAHPGPRGVLDRMTFEAIERELDLERQQPEWFVCGPAPMMNAVREALAARGVPTCRVHEERFASPARPSAGAPREAQTVTIRRGGMERTITVPASRTILEAALERGLALPFSCAIGGCAACKGKVVTGHVEVDEPNCLSAEERASGWTLTCVGRPTAPTTLEIP